MGLIARTAAAYKRLARGLVTHDFFLRSDTIDGHMEVLGAEFARLDARAMALVDEVHPETTSEMLEAWERVAGIPECSYVGLAATEAERQQTLAAKLLMRGGKAAAYFAEAATALGATVEITTPLVALLGWEVKTSEVSRFRAGSGRAGDSLITWTDLGLRLKCFFEKYKPSHTWIFWTD